MKKTTILLAILALAAPALLEGCAGSGSPRQVQPDHSTALSTEARIRSAPVKGVIDIDITNILGKKLPSRIDLFDAEGNPPLLLEAPGGVLEKEIPAGEYRAYVHVYEDSVPYLVEIQELVIAPNRPSYLLVNLLEGASGGLRLRDHDYDGDLAINRVEEESGTDPQNAAQIPGKPMLPFSDRVLEGKAGWYRGELFSHSKYGRGSESVGQLIRRAERAGLDFLAITDLNTFQAAYDPEFRSDRLVLIPAMTWGNDRLGYALIYGPRTLPEPPDTLAAAQAQCIRVQVQGGIYAIAHPCFPTAPWQWGLSYVNAVQVWNRSWTGVPPLSLAQLDERWKERREGRLVHSIAAAVAPADLVSVSANDQAARFWDYELNRGLMAAGIAGSSTASPKVPIGRPITYIHAREKSLPALLEGLRLGRTYLSSGPDGPIVSLSADVLNNGKVDVGIGGVVPLRVDFTLIVGVVNALGKKVELLHNGRPIITKIIEDNHFVIRVPQNVDSYSVYRVRVFGPADKSKGALGDVEVLAMTSPIYAQDLTDELMMRNPSLDPENTWIRLQQDVIPEVSLPEHLPPAVY
jgi:hypothetical protein